MSDPVDGPTTVPEAPAEPAAADGFRDVITLDEGKVRGHLDRVVRETVEQTLNALLDAEADELCGAKRYQRPADRDSTPGPAATTAPCTPPPAR